MDFLTMTIRKQKNIALIAHDNKKRELIDWCEANKEILKKHFLCGTGTTARMIDPDVKALLRIAQVYDIPIANNKATADFMITSPLMDEEYEHDIINFHQNIKERAKKL